MPVKIGAFTRIFGITMLPVGRRDGATFGAASSKMGAGDGAAVTADAGSIRRLPTTRLARRRTYLVCQ